MTTVETLPIGECVAQVEYLIWEMPFPEVGTFARWSRDESQTIEIIGRIKLRGMFGGGAVRWVCKAYGSKGLFGKGYIEMPVERLVRLPLVK